MDNVYVLDSLNSRIQIFSLKWQRMSDIMLTTVIPISFDYRSPNSQTFKVVKATEMYSESRNGFKTETYNMKKALQE
jgi:hypothetical protein